MSPILKLTAIAYLLTGLGISAALVPHETPDNRTRTSSVPQVLNRLSFVSITLAQAPDAPKDGSGQPEGETGDAGSRV